MISVILQTAARILLPLTFLFSVFLLVRGHNEPGGGFIGGLVAAAALALYMIAFDVSDARHMLRTDPRSIAAAGLLIAVSAGLLAFIAGDPFFTGLWAHIELPAIGEIELGTPLLFDVGVYLTVIGVTLTVIFSLAEE